MILDGLELFQAITMLLSDILPESVDVVFGHGRSFGDEDEVLTAIATAYSQGVVQNVLIPGTNGHRCGNTLPHGAWAGQEEWTKRLNGLGVNTVHYTDLDTCHTRDETDAFLHYAKKMGWTSAAVATQPHQILRAMLGTVQSMSQHDIPMTVYALTPGSVSWKKDVLGSQGRVHGSRFGHIVEELERILLYQESGDLCSLDELIGYLRNRS